MKSWPRPGDLNRARGVLNDRDGVLEIQTYGDLMHIFVEDAEAGQAAILQALEAAGVAVSAVRQIRPRMEDAFISLIRRQGVADQDAEALLNNVNHLA